MQKSWVLSLDQEDSLKKGMAIHSSILSWRIPWTQEACELQSMRSQRVICDWATNTHTQTYIIYFLSLLIISFLFFFLSLKHFYLFIWLCQVLVTACRITFPDQGLNPGSLHWKCRVLATGPPGKSQNLYNLSGYFSCIFFLHPLLLLLLSLFPSSFLTSIFNV